MKCIFCGGDMKQANTIFAYEEKGNNFIIEHVPAESCSRCGEKAYSSRVTDGLLRLARTSAKLARKIEAPMYDFAVNQ